MDIVKRIRTANPDDLKLLASCIVKISQHVKKTGPEVFVRGLPETVDDETLAWVQRFAENGNAVAFIVEKDEKAIGVIFCEISPTSFAPSGLGDVGHITACWVERECRQSGVATLLVSAAEEWFRKRNAPVIELAFLAGNEIAGTAWSHLGYRPFRHFAYKRLNYSDAS